MVGIDVGILKYIHDTDGTAVGSLDLSEERDRLEREHRNLSRKEHGSNNWENQRQTVAECHQQIKRKRRDFLHKLSTCYAREYELVAVEDLDVKEMVESSGNSRNTASAAWNTFTDLLEYKCKREGTHFVEVEPKAPPKSVPVVVWKPRNRCGCVNIPVRRVGSRRTETQTQRGTFFFADSQFYEWVAPK